MIVTLTSEYALRAMIYLANNEDRWPIPGNQIAKDVDIPRKYLSKILADLVRARVLEATRGKTGGFRMARGPKNISVGEVLAPFEPILGNRRPCPFGNLECNDDDPCSGHSRWKIVREAYRKFTDDTSIHDVMISKAKKPKRQVKKRARKKSRR